MDLRKYTRTFYHSVLPSLKCPCCQKCHYPLYCYHYCKRACYAKVLMNLVINESFYEDQELLADDELSSGSENPSYLEQTSVFIVAWIWFNNINIYLSCVLYSKEKKKDPSYLYFLYRVPLATFHIILKTFDFIF